MIENLFNLLQDAIKTCYKKDLKLIEMGMEQASVARIFYYMQTLINTTYTAFKDYNLDCEYNKKYKGFIKVTPHFRNGIRVDLLLHKREYIDNTENLLAVEFKSRKGKNEKFNGKIKDKVKLEDLTKTEGDFAYRLGAFIKLNKKKAEYSLFKNGIEYKTGYIINE